MNRAYATGAAITLIAALCAAASRPPEILFEKTMLDPGAFETCAAADINRNGRLDIVSGENGMKRLHGQSIRSAQLSISGTRRKT